jgi:glycosyltransferase involved in cell wall biosynthesis
MNRMPEVLWWGRFDPGYSRNRILRGLFGELGWTVRDFHPRLSALADVEAGLRGVARPDLVWVPCFRQRDVAAACRWARRRGVPLVFDPLISAYDKQVDERGKLEAGSARAGKLLERERRQFGCADRVVADTPAHADYFAQVLGVAPERLDVIFVGAEAALFRPAPAPVRDGDRPLEVLFYGSFIPLQGPQVVVEAARLYRGPPVTWTLLGQGPLRAECEAAAAGLTNVRFEDRLPYAELPARIHRADILLGVFGTTPKAGRVIPNKVYQALACGRPVVTRVSPAYPDGLREASDSGLVWTKPGDAASLAEQVGRLASAPDTLEVLGRSAARSSTRYFSPEALREQLAGTLERLCPPG